MTYDAMAVRIMLDASLSPAERDRRLATLAEEARAATTGGDCPECGSDREKEDNGQGGLDLTFLCLDCGHQWSPMGD